MQVTALAASLLGVPVAVVRTGGEGSARDASLDAHIPGSIVGHVDPSILEANADDLTVFDDARRAQAAFGLGFHASAPMTRSVAGGESP